MERRIPKNTPVLRWLALVSLVAFTLPQAAPAGNFRCFLNFTFVSINARVGARSYKQIAARNLSGLDQSLRAGFGQSLRDRPSQDVLDVGGGFSIYGIELAKAGHDVVTVNMQDFYQDAAFPLINPVVAGKFFDRLPEGEEGRYIIGRGPISTQFLTHISSALDVPLPEALQVGQNDLLYFSNVGSSRVDLQACKLEYSIVSPK